MTDTTNLCNKMTSFTPWNLSILVAEQEIDKMFCLAGKELCSFNLRGSGSKHNFALRTKGDVFPDWGL